MRASLCVLLCIVAAMLLAPPVAATSAIYLDNASQSSQSDAVVLATVESIRPAIHPRWKRPLVMTRIRVDEILVGEAPRHHHEQGQEHVQGIEISGTRRAERDGIGDRIERVGVTTLLGSHGG